MEITSWTLLSMILKLLVINVCNTYILSYYFYIINIKKHHDVMPIGLKLPK